MSDRSEKMPRNNEPAFPFTELNGNGDPYQAFPGMQMRDYFAAAALQSMLAQPQQVDEEKTPALAARLAYAFADAMMAEREK